MKKICSVILMCAILLSGCGDSVNLDDYVTKEEYDAVVEQNNSLEQQIQQMQSDYSEREETETDDVQSNNGSEGYNFRNYNSTKNYESFDISEGVLLQRGYTNIHYIVYLKIEIPEEGEKPIAYIVACHNLPVQVFYLMKQVSREFHYNCDFVLTWNGEDYVMNDETNNISGEEYIEDWREMLETIQSGDDTLDNMISLAWARVINDDLEDFFDD